MHNEGEGNSITAPKETERLAGELEIDYQRNRVMFYPNALRELTFSLPLTPSDVDVVRSLAQITRKLETHSSATIAAEIKLPIVTKKPTAPLRNNFSVFAMTLCRDLSLSRLWLRPAQAHCTRSCQLSPSTISPQRT